MDTERPDRTAKPPTEPAVWQRIKTIAADALERPEADRAPFVETACAGDDALRHQVESLLRATIRAGDRFEAPSASLLLGVVAPHAPDSLDASRNLSLGCTRRGPALERLDDKRAALAWFRQSLALDRARVEREPATAPWRLDLSFALGAVARLLVGTGDFQEALEHYRQAVELRRAVAAADPNDEFASASLARGTQEMAVVTGRLGLPCESLEWSRRRVAVYRARLEAHPERDDAWREYATATVEAAAAALDVLELPATSHRARARGSAQIRSMLGRLTGASARWTRARGSGRPLVPPDTIETLLDRLDRIPNRAR